MTDVTIQNTVSGNVHTFTFADGMVQTISGGPNTDTEDVDMPQSGPGAAYSIDINGVKKELVVNGTLFPTDTTRVTGVGAPTITTILQMKYWLEALQSATQSPKVFTSNYESYMLVNSSGTTTIDGVQIPGNWVATKVYVKSFSFDENVENSIDGRKFTLVLRLAGN